MTTDTKVSITISTTKGYRDQLRTMAAKRNLLDPDQITSASTIAREIICEHIDELEELERHFLGTSAEETKRLESEQDDQLEIEK
jgi:hypothetical protein